MALQFQEHYESGDGSLGQNAGDVYRLLVWGDPILDNADDPATIILSAIPQFAETSALGNTVTSFGREKIAPGRWIVTATYTSPTDARQSTDSQFSFTTGGGSQHITHSRKTVNGYGPEGGNPPPNFQGAINVSGEGSVDGIDIPIGSFEFKTTHYLPTLSEALFLFLRNNPYAVNTDNCSLIVDGITVSAQPGELQYQYAEGSKRKGFGDWELTIHWAISPNRTNFEIGTGDSVIIIDSKNGWDYMWVAYGPTADPSAMAITQQPIGVYIEQVFPYQALSQLIIALKAPDEIPWTSPTAGAPAIG